MDLKWKPTSVLGYKDGTDQPIVEDLTNTLFKNPQVFAEKILKQKAVSASITMPSTELSKDGSSVLTKVISIPFYMSDDFSVGSLRNNWKPILDFDGINSITQLLNFVSSYNGGANVTMQSELMSLKTWQGSTFSGFSVNCLFVATNRRINPTRIIRNLATAALPTKLSGDRSSGVTGSIDSAKHALERGVDTINSLVQEVSTRINESFNSNKEEGKKININFQDAFNKTADLFKGGLEDMGMVAPLHYGIAIDAKDSSTGYKKPLGPVPETTLTLQIGDYFRATELLVESIDSITFSKEVIAPKAYNSEADFRKEDLYKPVTSEENHSFPLWGSCRISFVPCSMMTREKFLGYFLDPYDTDFGGLKDALNPLVLPTK